MVSEVALEYRVEAVLGLEVAAVAQTLVVDEDGVYDPNLYNDRLLLGLKGT